MTEKWTSSNIPDLTGKVIIVTGGNSGIGYEAAKEFTRKGAQTILACRNTEKAQKALDKLTGEIPDATAEVMQLDLASLKSIHQFAEAFKQKYDRLDVLLNNAGIMMVPYGKTEDGFERQLGTNHLGHFALTGLLLDVLRKTPGARIVNVSSLAHHQGQIDFDNLQFDDGNGYTPQKAYGRSKLANLLFTYELQRRLEAAGADTIAVAVHPGISNTGLADHFPGIKFLRPLLGFFLQSSKMGALPSIRASVEPAVEGAQFYGPDHPKETRGYPVVVQSTPASHNQADAQKLWEISEQLTGVRYL